MNKITNQENDVRECSAEQQNENNVEVEENC
jgi:hypothetical protein